MVYFVLHCFSNLLATLTLRACCNIIPKCEKSSGAYLVHLSESNNLYIKQNLWERRSLRQNQVDDGWLQWYYQVGVWETGRLLGIFTEVCPVITLFTWLPLEHIKCQKNEMSPSASKRWGWLLCPDGGYTTHVFFLKSIYSIQLVLRQCIVFFCFCFLCAKFLDSVAFCKWTQNKW